MSMENSYTVFKENTKQNPTEASIWKANLFDK
jgi:hypothetical protein